MLYKNIETGEKVRIVQDADKFYTLDNGMKIQKQLFGRKFSIINESNNSINTSNENIDPENFLNQKTNIQMSTSNNIHNLPKTPTQNYNQPSTQTMEDRVNPDDFFSQSMSVDGLNNIKNMDTSKMVDVPDTQKTQVVDRTNDVIQQRPTNNMADEKARLLEKFNQQQSQQKNNGIGSQPIDENDTSAVDNMIKNQQPPKPVQTLNENGLTEHQEYLRKQQIELTGIDPFLEKIKKYKAEQESKKLQNNVNEQVSEVIKQPTTQSIQQTEIVQQHVEPVNNDPVYSFFKSSKRNHEISVSINIKDKIGNPEFIKMMSENLEGDFIKYYTEDILKTFLSDIKNVERIIYDQVYREVFGDIKTIEPVKVEPEPVKVEDEKTTLNINNKEKIVSDVIKLIPGKMTKTGKQTFKYINEEGKVVDILIDTAEKRNLKPYNGKNS